MYKRTDYLALAHVNMVHIKKRNDISILVIVKSNTYLVKDQLNIKSRCILIDFMIDDDLESVKKRIEEKQGLTRPSPDTGLRIYWWGLSRSPCDI